MWIHLFSRFTAAARRVMQRAFREAKRCEHDFVGTEHLLFGLLDELDGPAVTLLRSLNAQPELVLEKVELSLKRHDGGRGMEQVPLSPASKRVFRFAVDEAAAFNHQMIGPEHLILAILREPDCEAAQLLTHHGVSGARVRDAVARIPPDTYHDAQIRAEDRFTPSDNPSAAELERWIAPTVRLETTPSVPLPFLTPPAEPAALEQQLRRTQLFLGMVMGYCYGHWLYGWQLGLAIGSLGLAVGYLNNLWLSIPACSIIPLLLLRSNFDRQESPSLFANVVTLLTGLLVGSFLSDFWRYSRTQADCNEPDA